MHKGSSILNHRSSQNMRDFFFNPPKIRNKPKLYRVGQRFKVIKTNIPNKNILLQGSVEIEICF